MLSIPDDTNTSLQHTQNTFVETSTLALHQYHSAYELQSYLRLVELPHVIVYSHYSSYASTGPLPQIQYGSALVGANRALSFLRTLRQPLGDESLHESQIADSTAWIELIHGTLDDALLRSRFDDGYSALDGSTWGLGTLLQNIGAQFDESLISLSKRLVSMEFFLFIIFMER